MVCKSRGKLYFEGARLLQDYNAVALCKKIVANTPVSCFYLVIVVLANSFTRVAIRSTRVSSVLAL